MRGFYLIDYRQYLVYHKVDSMNSKIERESFTDIYFK